MSRSKVLLLLLFCVLAQGAMAQSKVISGTVEDPMGPVMFALYDNLTDFCRFWLHDNGKRTLIADDNLYGLVTYV